MRGGRALSFLVPSIFEGTVRFNECGEGLKDLILGSKRGEENWNRSGGSLALVGRRR